MKPKALKSSERKKRMIIKKAISRFISNTQKIVQKVKPGAEILISDNRPAKKKRLIKLREKIEGSDKLEAATRFIRIPDFREISLNDLNSSQSEDDVTDSEEIANIHSLLEQNEYFVRARPEIRKVKASGRSTDKIHANGETFTNFSSSLGKLEKLVPKSVFCDYLYEGIHYLQWPVTQPIDNLAVNFNRYY